MATPPVTPNPNPQVPQMLASSIPQEIHAALQDQVHSLAQKHVQVSYLLMGVLGLTLVLGGLGAYFAAKWVDRAMARAEKSEELFKADKAASDKALTDLKVQLAASEQARAISDQKVADMQKQISNIAVVATKQKEEVLKPGKTATEAFTDLKTQYKAAISSPLNIVESADKTEQQLVLRVPDVQQFTATKIDADAAHATITLKDQQLSEKDTQLASLKTDFAAGVDTYQKLLTTDDQCQDALKQYKKIAKVSRIRRIFNGALKPAIFVAGFVAGYEAGKHF